jgi:hypothetical protein
MQDSQLKSSAKRAARTLALFRDGKVIDVLVGLQPKARISRLLERAEG